MASRKYSRSIDARGRVVVILAGLTTVCALQSRALVVAFCWRPLAHFCSTCNLGRYLYNHRKVIILASRAGSSEPLDGLQETRAQFREMGYALETDFKDTDSPREYYREMRGTDVGNAFWRQSFEGKWGEYAEGDAGQFDKDDLVEAVYAETGEWYSAQVMKYIGNSDWIVIWLDDLPEGSVQASVVKTKDMKHIKVHLD